MWAGGKAQEIKLEFRVQNTLDQQNHCLSLSVSE